MESDVVLPQAAVVFISYLVTERLLACLWGEDDYVAFDERVSVALGDIDWIAALLHADAVPT